MRYGSNAYARTGGSEHVRFCTGMRAGVTNGGNVFMILERRQGLLYTYVQSVV